jgi:AcrR family transcriptional regulator
MSTDNELEKKPRKVTSGPVRDKARTMARMVAAVGSALLKHGYCGLTPNNIIKEAKVDRKLLQVHFGSLEQLIEAYVKQKAFVLLRLKSDCESLSENGKSSIAQFTDFLKWAFTQLLNDKEVVKLLHWELGENSRLLDAFSEARLQLEGCIKQHAIKVYIDKDIKHTQSLLSLFLAGAYYLLMQCASSNPLFKETNTVEDGSGEDSLSKMVDLVFGKL